MISQIKTQYLEKAHIKKNNTNLRTPNQTDISQACFIVEIYHSGPEPSKL